MSVSYAAVKRSPPVLNHGVSYILLSFVIIDFLTFVWGSKMASLSQKKKKKKRKEKKKKTLAVFSFVSVLFALNGHTS